MDTMRGNFSGQGAPDGDSRDYDPGDDETGRELPPSPVGQDERRMQVRAYNFWASLLHNRNFPSIEDLDPDNLPDFGPYSALLDFTCGIEDPAVQFIGAKLAEECGTNGPIAQLSEVPNRSLLSRITDHYLQIIANQAPIGFEAEFVNQRGATILYRGILLPFSSDDDTIDFIYGVINWKELADQQTTDELLLEIDQALDARPEISRSNGPLTTWADGPADYGSVLNLVTPIDDSDAAAQGANHDLPVPAYGGGLADGEDMALVDWLASARELAHAAQTSDDRSRQALYAAVGRAYDFSLAAEANPGDFAELVADAGLAIQDRAPMTPVVKLVFGADYDKTRLTEYAAALGHARRLGLARGELAGHLASAPGGLKGVVAAERQLRRGETGKPTAIRESPRAALAHKLRKLEHRPLGEFAAEGKEFTLLVARRLASGEIVLLGEVDSDALLIERAARRLLG